MTRFPAALFCLAVLLGSGCASSRALNRQEERQLKVELVKEYAREMTPVQRTHFLSTRFGTEELVRDRLWRMIEANRVQGRSALRDQATLMELYKLSSGPRVSRSSPGADPVTGTSGKSK